MRLPLFALTAIWCLSAALPAVAQSLLLPQGESNRIDFAIPPSQASEFDDLSRKLLFEPITSYPNSRYAALGRSIGRLDILTAAGERLACTGWLIPSGLVITADHCITGETPSKRATRASLVLGYAPSAPRDSWQSIELDIRPLDRSPFTDLDYTVLAPKRRSESIDLPSVPFGPSTMRQASAGEPLFIVGHPGGQPQQLARAGCRAIGQPERTSAQRIRFDHLCSTLRGSSGSPIFSEEDGALIGLHSAATNTSKQAVPLPEILLKSAFLHALASPPELSNTPTRKTTKPPAASASSPAASSSVAPPAGADWVGMLLFAFILVSLLWTALQHIAIALRAVRRSIPAQALSATGGHRAGALRGVLLAAARPLWPSMRRPREAITELLVRIGRYGVTKRIIAIKWLLLLASAGGSPHAATLLAQYYSRNDTKARPDFTKAMSYAAAAQERGSPNAFTALPSLREGMSGPAVDFIRSTLFKAYSNRPLAAGTPFDEKLALLVSDFQAECGLNRSGIVESATWEQISRIATRNTGVQIQCPPATSQPARSPRPVGSFFRDHDDAPMMVAVPAGRFRMGIPLGGDSLDVSVEQPSHEVIIPRPFAVGRFPVTCGQFAKFLSEIVVDGQCSRIGQLLREEWHPVVNVSWRDAQLYIAWLNGRTGRRYRLLSEAEWEYVARAGTTSAFSTGERLTPRQANVDYAPDGPTPFGTEPVGHTSGNNFKVTGMHGNVREWTEDRWHDSYLGAPTNGQPWLTSGHLFKRVVRGGSWNRPASMARSVFRSAAAITAKELGTGFRIARDLDPDETLPD